jgi:hypothetical protein
LNQGEKTGGQGQHVTIGAFVNVAGDFLEPIFLFCGAESSQPNSHRKLLAAGFENPCVLMKKGKASMDDKIVCYYFGMVCRRTHKKKLHWQTRIAH